MLFLANMQIISLNMHDTKMAQAKINSTEKNGLGTTKNCWYLNLSNCYGNIPAYNDLLIENPAFFRLFYLLQFCSRALQVGLPGTLGYGSW